MTAKVHAVDASPVTRVDARIAAQVDNALPRSSMGTTDLRPQNSEITRSSDAYSRRMAPPRGTLLDMWQSTGDPLPRVLTVHPAIADTSALVCDLMWSSRTGRPSRLLMAMQVGVVRVYVAEHVWAEVPRKIDELGDEGKLDAAVAAELWWTSYIPLVRVVDTGLLPHIEAPTDLVNRDRSDTPTERLRSLLAPVVVLATDKDLIKLGLAHEDWFQAASAGGAIAMAGGGMYGGTLLTVGVVHGVAGLARLTMRLFRLPVVQAIVIGALTLGIATHELWRPAIKRRLCSAKDRSGDWTDALLVAIDGVVDLVGNAFTAWDASMTGTLGGTSTHELARSLASSHASTRTELVHRLRPDLEPGEHHRLLARLRPVLEDCSAFVESSRGRWQIGRAGVDFGGPIALEETGHLDAQLAS